MRARPALVAINAAVSAARRLLASEGGSRAASTCHHSQVVVVSSRAGLFCAIPRADRLKKIKSEIWRRARRRAAQRYEAAGIVVGIDAKHLANCGSGTRLAERAELLSGPCRAVLPCAGCRRHGRTCAQSRQ